MATAFCLIWLGFVLPHAGRPIGSGQRRLATGESASAAADVRSSTWWGSSQDVGEEPCRTACCPDKTTDVHTCTHASSEKYRHGWCKAMMHARPRWVPEENLRQALAPPRVG